MPVIRECLLIVNIDGEQYPDKLLVVADDAINSDMLIGLTHIQ